MMLRFKIPVDKGNEAVEDGTLAETIEELVDDLKPEATYFYADDGDRAALMVFDMTDASQCAEIAERLFQELEAQVELLPVMNADELRRGLKKAAN
jgi:hypothetical protein